ncbi:hypothetical protein CI238_10050, partial [Colletotrichum incanum]
LSNLFMLSFSPIVDKHCNFHQVGRWVWPWLRAIIGTQGNGIPLSEHTTVLFRTQHRQPVSSIERTPFRHDQPRRRRSWGRRSQVPPPGGNAAGSNARPSMSGEAGVAGETWKQAKKTEGFLGEKARMETKGGRKEKRPCASRSTIAKREPSRALAALTARPRGPSGA